MPSGHEIILRGTHRLLSGLSCDSLGQVPQVTGHFLRMSACARHEARGTSINCMGLLCNWRLRVDTVTQNMPQIGARARTRGGGDRRPGSPACNAGVRAAGPRGGGERRRGCSDGGILFVDFESLHRGASCIPRGVRAVAVTDPPVLVVTCRGELRALGRLSLQIHPGDLRAVQAGRGRRPAVRAKV